MPFKKLLRIIGIVFAAGLIAVGIAFGWKHLKIEQQGKKQFDQEMNRLQ